MTELDPTPLIAVAVAVMVPTVAGIWRLAQIESRVDHHDAILERIEGDVKYIRDRIDRVTHV